MTTGDMAQRVWFRGCRMLGRMMRAGRYSKVHVPSDASVQFVHKSRRWYAPVVVAFGSVLMRALGTGVCVLPRREWQQREQLLYRELYSQSVLVNSDDCLMLPRLAGDTLAKILEDPRFTDHQRRTAIELAVRALADLHAHNLTHADAMAENVLVDLDSGTARWFDFETTHGGGISVRARADDLRALIATVVLRVKPASRDELVGFILETYPHDDVKTEFASHFKGTLRRDLVYHLGQAPLTFDDYVNIRKEIVRRSDERRTLRA